MADCRPRQAAAARAVQLLIAWIPVFSTITGAPKQIEVMLKLCVLLVQFSAVDSIGGPVVYLKTDIVLMINHNVRCCWQPEVKMGMAGLDEVEMEEMVEELQDYSEQFNPHSLVCASLELACSGANRNEGEALQRVFEKVMREHQANKPTLFETFCRETNLNGWHFITKKNIFSRIFFIFVISASIFLSGGSVYLILQE